MGSTQHRSMPVCQQPTWSLLPLSMVSSSSPPGEGGRRCRTGDGGRLWSHWTVSVRFLGGNRCNPQMGWFGSEFNKEIIVFTKSWAGCGERERSVSYFILVRRGRTAVTNPSPEEGTVTGTWKETIPGRKGMACSEGGWGIRTLTSISAPHPRRLPAPPTGRIQPNWRIEDSGMQSLQVSF